MSKKTEAPVAEAPTNGADEQKPEPTHIKDLLVQSVVECYQIGQELEQTRAQARQTNLILSTAQGRQEAYWKVFLGNRNITAQEALDQNLDGIGDAVQAASTPDPRA